VEPVRGSLPSEGPGIRRNPATPTCRAKGRYPPIVLKDPVAGACRKWRRARVGGELIGVSPSRSRDQLWSGDKLGQLTEVLGDCREVEFVAGAARPTQSQSVELEDAFEVGEQREVWQASVLAISRARSRAPS
jgi:hypothetical protein